MAAAAAIATELGSYSVFVLIDCFIFAPDNGNWFSFLLLDSCEEELVVLYYCCWF